MENPTVFVRPLAGSVGAVITELDASEYLTDFDIATLRQALLRHKVIFLRDQQLTYDQQVAFARRLGALTLGHPIYGAPTRQPHLREMDSAQGTRANHWHTDLTFIERPPAIALLHAITIPAVGGDTMWANTVAARDTLPPELRDLADALRVVHSNDSDYTDATVSARGDYVRDIYETEHPCVSVHPETGEKAILLGGFARRIPGYSPQASRTVLRLLQEHVERPEHTVRWTWRAGDLAIWDNRSTQHYAIADYDDGRRRLERLTTVGEVPVGPDGRPSRVLTGDPGDYNRSGDEL
ncbi:TauD/TfdA dioxygenase family protein [Streptomyces sp. NPDC001142]